MFCDFVTTSIIQSESAEDLLNRLVSTTSVTRRSGQIDIRTDNAPGFAALSKSKQGELKALKISIQYGDPKNKHSLAIVDKAIQELERELIKISLEGKLISPSDLAKATISLNSIIRNRNLTAHEITFAR